MKKPNLNPKSAGRPVSQPVRGTSVQTFRFRSPGALTVMLVGDFTRWQQQPIGMRQGPDGVWQAEVQLAPGTYHYRFLVDGNWQDDPECILQVPNPYGGMNAVRMVG